ncbi:acylphosphatase [Sphingobium sp. BYY-5]|uniref:acylphosphatase n=1 Tax=Sphingobium sp. BYY-5 TaxID=2926400 RepID=UPI001FA74DBB|nr:acylphosphatase [Sphingobium sp. BYY-5]MCI4589482.1 acylphosphatase [Sphingobium sp. BYY-5]
MVHGRVQGVWYRAWAAETACGLGLAGWVRNRTEGGVEMLLQGEAETIERFIMLAHEGPSAAQVMRIDTTDATVQALNGFEKHPTI